MIGIRPWFDTLFLNMDSEHGVKPYVDARYAIYALLGLFIGERYIEHLMHTVTVDGEEHLAPALGVCFMHWTNRATVAAKLGVTDATARKHVKALAERRIVKTHERNFTRYVFNPNMHEWDVPDAVFVPNGGTVEPNRYAHMWRVCEVSEERNTPAIRCVGFALSEQVTDVRRQIEVVADWHSFMAEVSE
jgi:ribosomal protein S25